MNPQTHRRRALAAMVGANIRREAVRLAAESGIGPIEAMTAVFADQDLLNRCHQVTGRPVPGPPQSSIDVQNRPWAALD